MNPHTLSASAQRILEGARAEAVRLEHDAIGAEHIVLALLGDGGPGRPVLQRLGLDAERVRQRLEAGGRRGRPRGPTQELAYTSHAKRLIETASKEAREAGTGLSADQLMLAALLESRGAMGKLLAEVGADADRVRTAVLGPEGSGSTGRAASESARGPKGARPARDAAPDAAGGPSDAGKPRSTSAHLTPRAQRRRISWRHLLLLALPVSIVLVYVLHAPAVWVFLTACLGILPLASYMGESTEHLAHRTGPTVGGLLNATFGNAAELIIAVVALRAGLVELVKASITGSILGNLLLILGLALIAGGTNRNELRFNRTNAGMSAGMLALSVVALVFPALYHSIHPEAGARLSELHMSEAVSVILIVTYGLSLLFTLKTHRRLFGGEPHPLDGPVWSVGRAVLVLGLATVGVAVESELLVHAATEATEAIGLSEVFLGLIVIPIIGNAAEHAAAVALSRKGQIDLGLQIALGSSTQVALLVAPLLVFAGLLLGTDMNLVFQPFEVIALGLATAVTAIITLDGESHWFEGVQLLAVYAMVAVGAFFLN
ncbi:MAG TPA: calcium/proton exchanger [Gemmatimonadales bacterium]|nr:calcium/proton exchanger [Gemmatimonadales bacterium]